MKVLAISGSPRNGNTEAMLKRILDGAADKDASIELVRLHDTRIEECEGCAGCEETGTCRIQDEMPKLYSKTMLADVLVLGSPNYFNNVSALMKKFIDRMNAYWEDKRLHNKKVVLVMPGGQGKKSRQQGMNAFEQFPKICKMQVVERLSPQLDRSNEAQQDKALMQKCFELGEKLASEQP